jgi:hypothetical protein
LLGLNGSERCLQWRLLFFSDEEGLPDKWYCEMNNDPLNNACKIPERSQLWYEQNRNRITEMIEKQIVGETNFNRETGGDNFGTTECDASKIELVKKDALLLTMGVLDLFNNKAVNMNQNGKTTPISVISDIQFQEMLQTESNDLAIEALESKVEEAPQASVFTVQKDIESATRNSDKQGLVDKSKSFVSKDFSVMRDIASKKTTSTPRKRSFKDDLPSDQSSSLSKSKGDKANAMPGKTYSNENFRYPREVLTKLSGSSQRASPNLPKGTKSVVNASVNKSGLGKQRSTNVNDNVSSLQKNVVDVQEKASTESTNLKSIGTISEVIPRKKPKLCTTNVGQSNLLAARSQRIIKSERISEVIDLLQSDEDVE